VRNNIAVIAILADQAAKYYKTYATADAFLTATLKTEGFYQRAMWKATRDLYNGEMGLTAFEDTMIELITGQLRRAWNEGLRTLNLDPQVDQTEEGENFLQDIMLSELSFVDGFADAVLAAARAQEPIDQFRARVDIWVNRYPDVVNQAIQFYAQTGQRLRWQLGQTEQHCQTCSALNNIVAFASEWETSGVKPQSPPNDLLSCSGWHCDCSLVPTDERRSADALTRIMDIITSTNL
jgi:hypothetical protein